MQARSLLAGSFHTPETLNVVGSAYGDAWAEIAHRFNGDAEKARLRLAHAVLAVAEDNGQSSETLKNAALKLMALASGSARLEARTAIFSIRGSSREQRVGAAPV